VGDIVITYTTTKNEKILERHEVSLMFLLNKISASPFLGGMCGPGVVKKEYKKDNETPCREFMLWSSIFRAWPLA
jgi:hypothetical protein